ncbi:pas pac sensor hybrid histidine kinase [Nannochloropsis oceanica]
MDFGPTTDQGQNQNQRGCLNKMKQQHNSLLSILLDDKEAHGGAVALCCLTTRFAGADKLPDSPPTNSSSWASSLLAASRALDLQKQAVHKSLESFLTQYQQQLLPFPIHQHPILKYKIRNLLSEASPSFQAQQQQNQHQQHLKRSHPPLQLHYPPKCQIQPPLKKQHVMTSTKCFLVNELVEAKRYPPIAPLSEASLSLQEIRTGVMGVSVGLLPGRCSEIMRKYIPSAEKQRRASKEDLSGLTAEEKVERRKIRARMYNRLSRHRRNQLHGELRSDVSRMLIYKNIIEDAPDMICVISPDIQSQVLYINKAARGVLVTGPAQLVGSSFWDIVHTEDKMALFRALTTVTFFKSAGKVERLCCLVVTNNPGVYMSVRMTLANGMQGIVCVMCNEDHLSTISRVLPDRRPSVM